MELARRKAKAESSYETRKRAYDQQATTASSPSSGGGVEKGQMVTEDAPGKRLAYPSRPRILNLSNETNYVGANQQEYTSVCGEKYGYFTVVNDAFFDSGPKASVIECTM